MKTRSSAVAAIADRTAHEVRYSYIDRWLECGQHEYLLIYSFKLKSDFDADELFSRSLCFVAKPYIVQQT